LIQNMQQTLKNLVQEVEGISMISRLSTNHNLFKILLAV
jgi:hypothetical protein